MFPSTYAPLFLYRAMFGSVPGGRPLALQARQHELTDAKKCDMQLPDSPMKILENKIKNKI